MRERILLLFLLLTWPAKGNDEEFRNPPSSYGPSAFWWWFVGAPYTDRDIRAGIDALQHAGLGGFRITPVYSFPGAQAGGPNYLSPGYLRLVQTAIEQANSVGMIPDALLGTGWPFGGPYIPTEMGASQLKHYFLEVEGTRVFSGSIPGTAAPGEILLAVQAAKARISGGIDLDTVVDLTAKVGDWSIHHWDVPPGRWVLMTFVSGKTGMKVKRAAPGGEGLVLDHFRREALDLHLRRNGDVQAPFMKGLRAVTMDSWEVFNANWTPALPTEFAHRRGYRLEPYLAALFYPAGEIGARVRYDFRKTISELALQNFFEPLRDWTHGNGFQTRVEAHGTPADIIEAYGLNDSPEAETYGRQDQAAIRIRDRRLASSAAHLFGRRQVSCETFTWLRYPLFSETLQQMKLAADASYLDGVNQINYHGVPFSPVSAPPPGFFFYASTFVSPGNTWWPYLPYLSSYLRRANFMLQQGEPVTDVAVYLPTEDVWSDAFGSWYDLAAGVEERLRSNGSLDMIESLQKAGYQFDFINGRRIEQGALNKYRAVVLPDIETIEPTVLLRLVEFRERGGLVAAIGRIPDRSPGLQNSAARDSSVRDLVSRLFPHGSNTLFPAHSVQALDPGNHPLAAWLRTMITPDLLSENLGDGVGFVHRRTPDAEIYFLTNLTETSSRFHGSFRVDQASPRVLDPETGDSMPVFEHSSENGRISVSLSLPPGKSLFLVFRPGNALKVSSHNVDRVLELDQAHAKAEVSVNGQFFVHSGRQRFQAAVEDLPAPLEIAGPWQFTVPGARSMRMDSLQDWTAYPEYAHFSGTASYQTEFMLSESWRRADQRLVLELEGVHEIAEIRLNGKLAGVAWKLPFNVDISGLVGKKNTLEIRVTNLLFNRMLTMTELPPPYVSLGKIHPRPLPSGLVGNVRIKPIRRIRLTP